MDLLNGNLVEVQKLAEPIHCIDIDFRNKEHYIYEIFTDEDLQNILSSHEIPEPGCRILSICQGNSWTPLQATEPMIRRLVNAYDFPQIFDVASCFYKRGNDLEEGFCLPLKWAETQSTIELCYSIRYQEWIPQEIRWAMRQTGLCHRLDEKTQQSVLVLFNPKPSSHFHKELVKALHEEKCVDMFQNHFFLHNLLLETYLPFWRQYMVYQEDKLLRIGRNTVVSYEVEKLEVGFRDLVTLINLHHRLLQAPTNISQVSETIEALIQNLSDRKPESQTPMGLCIKQTNIRLRNTMRQVQAYSRTAGYLQQRAQSTAQLLADKLSLQDQVLAKHQNGAMLSLNRSVVVITTLTLLYLPASFLAGVFGMEFFNIDTEHHGGKLNVATSIWIYVASTIILTAITMGVYYYVYPDPYKALAKCLKERWERRRKIEWISKATTSFRSQGEKLGSSSAPV